jgi:hypothetical protein
MFLQDTAGAGKTHAVRVNCSELHMKGVRWIVSATTDIAAVQYSGGQTVHSLFSLGFDERRNINLTSHIECGTGRDESFYRSG